MGTWQAVGGCLRWLCLVALASQRAPLCHPDPIHAPSNARTSSTATPTASPPPTRTHTISHDLACASACVLTCRVRHTGTGARRTWPQASRMHSVSYINHCSNGHIMCSYTLPLYAVHGSMPHTPPQHARHARHARRRPINHRDHCHHVAAHPTHAPSGR